MQEIIMSGRKPAVRPVVGFNFDRNVNTGNKSIAIPDANVQLPVPLSGYTRGRSLASGQLFTPASVIDGIGTKDFTLECRLYLTGGNIGNYYSIIYFRHSAGAFGLQFGDAGFGHRLQLYVQGTALSNTYATPHTKASLSDGKFHHLAFVRYNKVLYFYLDGVLAGIAAGTGTTYANSVPADVNITGGYEAGMGLVNGGVMPEFAIWDSALYKAAFTPPVGYLVR